MSSILDIDPYLGLSGLSVLEKAPVLHPEIDTGLFDLHRGEKEQTMSTPVPLITRTKVSRILGILASTGNLVSHVRADGSNNMSSALFSYKARLGLGLDNHGPVPEICTKKNSSTSSYN